MPKGGEEKKCTCPSGVRCTLAKIVYLSVYRLCIMYIMWEKILKSLLEMCFSFKMEQVLGYARGFS